MFQVSSTKKSFDNIIYKSNPQNANFDYLPFDGDNFLITIWGTYSLNDDIIFKLSNDFSVYV